MGRWLWALRMKVSDATLFCGDGLPPFFCLVLGLWTSDEENNSHLWHTLLLSYQRFPIFFPLLVGTSSLIFICSLILNQLHNYFSTRQGGFCDGPIEKIFAFLSFIADFCDPYLLPTNSPALNRCWVSLWSFPLGVPVFVGSLWASEPKIDTVEGCLFDTLKDVLVT